MEFTNCKAEIKKGILTLTIDLTQSFGPSGSGKTIKVASTNGNKDIENFPGYKLGLNIYKYPEK